MVLLRIKEWLTASKEPTLLEKSLCFAYDLFYFVRVQKPVAALFGPMYRRSQQLVELDITYACNLKCLSCNRSCGLAPSEDCLSLEQVQRFIDESVARKIAWKRIRLLGGEPTIHPRLTEIVAALLAYKRTYSPNALIELVTNGVGSDRNGVLDQLDAAVVVTNTDKKSKSNIFLAFNVAPRDLATYRWADFSCGCWVPELCGINFSPYGYYCCGAGAGIDRVFGFNVGRKSLPADADSLRDQMEVLCGYCIHFKTTRRRKISRQRISSSWQQALARYKTGRPPVSFY